MKITIKPKRVLASLYLIGVALISATSSAYAMSDTELADFARNHDYDPNAPVIDTVMSGSGCQAQYTLVSAWTVQDNIKAGIVFRSDCPFVTYTYFEVDADNLDSIAPFSEVSAGRSTRFSNWGPSANMGENYDWELLQTVAEMIVYYAE